MLLPHRTPNMFTNALRRVAAPVALRAAAPATAKAVLPRAASGTNERIIKVTHSRAGSEAEGGHKDVALGETRETSRV